MAYSTYIVNGPKKGSRGTVRVSRNAKDRACAPGHYRPKSGPHEGTCVRGIPTPHSGSLGGPGYTDRPSADRHKILEQHVSDHGYASTISALQSRINLGHRTTGSKALAVFRGDMKWLQRKYGSRNPTAALNMPEYTMTSAPTRVRRNAKAREPKFRITGYDGNRKAADRTVSASDGSRIFAYAKTKSDAHAIALRWMSAQPPVTGWQSANQTNLLPHLLIEESSRGSLYWVARWEAVGGAWAQVFPKDRNGARRRARRNPTTDPVVLKGVVIDYDAPGKALVDKEAVRAGEAEAESIDDIDDVLDRPTDGRAAFVDAFGADFGFPPKIWSRFQRGFKAARQRRLKELHKRARTLQSDRNMNQNIKVERIGSNVARRSAPARNSSLKYPKDWVFAGRLEEGGKWVRVPRRDADRILASPAGTLPVAPGAAGRAGKRIAYLVTMPASYGRSWRSEAQRGMGMGIWEYARGAIHDPVDPGWTSRNTRNVSMLYDHDEMLRVDSMVRGITRDLDDAEASYNKALAKHALHSAESLKKKLPADARKSDKQRVTAAIKRARTLVKKMATRRMDVDIQMRKTGRNPDYAHATHRAAAGHRHATGGWGRNPRAKAKFVRVDDGDGNWVAPIHAFVRDNREDVDLVTKLRDLRVGGVVMAGGGAAPLVKITGLGPDAMKYQSHMKLAIDKANAAFESALVGRVSSARLNLKAARLQARKAIDMLESRSGDSGALGDAEHVLDAIIEMEDALAKGTDADVRIALTKFPFGGAVRNPKRKASKRKSTKKKAKKSTKKKAKKKAVRRKVAKKKAVRRRVAKKAKRKTTKVARRGAGSAAIRNFYNLRDSLD